MSIRLPFFKAAVIGQPVTHSLSPLIHAYWLQKYEMPGTYDAREIAPDELTTQVRALIADGYTGFNVTIPHKQAVMKLCHTVDKTAQRIGAVNTISVGADSALRGSNTDAQGFVDHLHAAVPAADLKTRSVLILGAGGAARAVIDGLQQAGFAPLTIANRTNAAAEKLAVEFGVAMTTWGKLSMTASAAGLVINTTAGGMAGKPSLDFDAAWLQPDAIVCDIVYTPLRTKLLRDAAARGCQTVEGLGMLIQQARRSFEIWTGILPDTDPMLEKLLQEKLGP